MTSPAETPHNGTDNALFLAALMDAFPGWVERPSSRLEITAHIRAADLRALGWDIECRVYADPQRPRKRVSAYRLVTAPTSYSGLSEDENGQLQLTA